MTALLKKGSFPLRISSPVNVTKSMHSFCNKSAWMQNSKVYTRIEPKLPVLCHWNLENQASTTKRYFNQFYKNNVFF